MCIGYNTSQIISGHIDKQIHNLMHTQFKDKIDGIFPTKNGSIYTLIDTESIKKIKLGG